jgi:multicomponent Na+:H+ antiporter subunit E
MAVVRSRVIRGVTLFLLWLVLSHPISGADAVVGAIVAFVIAALPFPGPDVYAEIRLLPRRIAMAVAFVVVFLSAVVRSNIDVAFRVLSPQLPINPGIVRVRTKLRSRIGRLLLANSITLTPGTISVAIDGEDLYVHWINTSARDVEESTRAIVSGFEKYLEVSFG